MDDLLKDAIADAKAVRETALENAKIALEEAFTPRLQSMLSKKIQSEIEDEDDIEERDDEDEDPEERMDLKAGDEDPSDDDSEDEVDEIEMDDEDEVDEIEMDDEEDVEEGVIEINGVKYAPVVSEEEDEDEEIEESDDLDLDEILKELDEEEGEDDEDEPVDESKEEDEVEEVTEAEDEDEDKEDVDEEVDQSSGIGSSDNKNGSADKSSGIGSKGKAKHESVELTEEDDIDLEEIVKALSEEEDEEEEKNENSRLQSELDEHRNVVKYLRSKLNEVNLLNAKLLFTNKLFRSYGLNNDQKMKVVENFDRAHNLREVKLVYSTLAESFGSKQNKTEIKESKGSASKPVASTKSEKQEVIAEGHEMRDRFKKLAGIL